VYFVECAAACLAVGLTADSSCPAGAPGYGAVTAAGELCAGACVAARAAVAGVPARAIAAATPARTGAVAPGSRRVMLVDDVPEQAKRPLPVKIALAMKAACTVRGARVPAAFGEPDIRGA